MLALGGCASVAPQTTQLRNTLSPELHKHVELTQVPFFPQDEYQCGPAALATVLNTYGVKVTPEELVPEVYLPARKGSLQVEMLAAARRHGLVSYQLAPRAADLLREVAAGNPVIVLQNLGFSGDTWHYAVVVGYDYYWGKIYLRSGQDEREVLPFFFHEVLWMRGGYWAMVALPPDRIPETADQDRWLAAVAALEHAGDVRNARTAYQAFLKRWPSNANGAIGLANTYHAAGELKEAESVLRGAERTSPDSVVVLNNLAQTLSDQGRDAEALPIIERAAKLGGPFSEAVEDTKRGIQQKLAKTANSGQRP